LSVTDVASIRRLVSAAITVQQRRDIEPDQHRLLVVTILSRRSFEALARFAIENAGVLAALFPTIELFRERLVICQALSRALVPFWIALTEQEVSAEQLAYRPPLAVFLEDSEGG
jgi:hypothetical protein